MKENRLRRHSVNKETLPEVNFIYSNSFPNRIRSSKNDIKLLDIEAFITYIYCYTYQSHSIELKKTDSFDILEIRKHLL